MLKTHEATVADQKGEAPAGAGCALGDMLDMDFCKREFGGYEPRHDWRNIPV